MSDQHPQRSGQDRRHDLPPRAAALASAVRPHARQAYEAVRRYAGEQYDLSRARLADPATRPATAGLLAAAAGLFVFLLYWIGLVVATPSVGRLEEMHMAEATIAYTADGQELTRYHIENRTWVPLDSIARPVVEALVATEDHRFYEHGGIAVARVFGAVLGTAAGDKQGGSTITMQLARNIFPGIHDDPILQRKLREWLTAKRLESRFTKDEILELYLNAVPFMYDAVGIEAAARTYFQKPAKALTLAESATLIGMLKATVYYNPVRHPERSHERRNTVLQQMVRHGYLRAEDYAALRDVPTELHFRRLTRHDNTAPYFAEYVRQWLDRWGEEHGYNLYTDGLRVYTTIDARLQAAAEAAVREVGEELQAVVDVEWSAASPFYSARTDAYQARRAQVEPFAHFWRSRPEVLDELIRGTPRFRRLARELPADSALAVARRDTAFVDSLRAKHQRLEAGFIAIDPSNGHIKAWVGGRDFSADEYDHVALARRQPGSTFKPFVYAAALENGFGPNSLLPDVVRSYVDPYTRVAWTPQNFGGASGQLMTLRQGLAHSKNTITAQLIAQVGAKEVARIAHLAGIRSELQEVPSLALGTSEVTLLELANAYATLASQGVRRAPVPITRIEDRDGNVLASFSAKGEQVIPPHTAYAVVDMMRGGVQYGTAVRMRSLFGARGDLAGKTGTTQNAADGWFMFLHPDLVMGSWVGFDSPLVTFRSQYWGQGAHNALHVTGAFYRAARTQLDAKAIFEGSADHAWGPGILTEADALTRQERQKTNLDDILRRLRQAKGQQ